MIKTPSSAKKAFTAKWSKVSSKATGYEIAYSTSKSFGSNVKYVTVDDYNTTSVKIEGLSSKKTYYIKVRTCYTVDGETYKSAWSGVKSVKTK